MRAWCMQEVPLRAVLLRWVRMHIQCQRMGSAAQCWQSERHSHSRNSANVASESMDKEYICCSIVAYCLAKFARSWCNIFGCKIDASSLCARFRVQCIICARFARFVQIFVNFSLHFPYLDYRLSCKCFRPNFTVKSCNNMTVLPASTSYSFLLAPKSSSLNSTTTSAQD
jgi:hypothetical protein